MQKKVIEIKLNEYAPIRDNTCTTSADQDQVYEIKFHGNPVNKFPLKNSNTEKTKEKSRIKEIFFSAKVPTSKIASPKNKDRNSGINIRAKGIKPLNISSCVKDIEIQQLPNKKKPKPKLHPKQKKYRLDFFFLYIDCVLFLTSKIKNNKIENVKKFINVKLYGAKPSIVIAPSKKGAKNITKNLLLSIEVKLKPLFLTN